MGIMLADHVSKLFGKYFRTFLMEVIAPTVLTTQLGLGLNHGDVARAHLYVRNMLGISSASKVSSAFIFLDLSTAFAIVQRPYVLVICLPPKNG